MPIPTARTAAILALIAGAALLVPPGLAALAILVLLGCAIADAWSVRSPPRLTRTAASVLARGAAAEFAVRAVHDGHRTVLLRQPATEAVSVHARIETGRRAETVLRGRMTPRRRGSHVLPGVACASIGPLGLARIDHRAGDPLRVRVYPDVLAARRAIARLRRRPASHPGGLARGPLGLGTELESVREYAPEDDIRQLNWRASARVGRPMSNEYRVERDREVVCLVDSGRLMAAPLRDGTMLDAALDSVTMLALLADELGDRCGVIAFDDRVRVSVAPRHRGGRTVIEALSALEPTTTDSDFELAFTRVGGARRAFVAVLTDLVDEAAARSLIAAVPILARRHSVTVASVVDPALQDALDAASPGGAGGAGGAAVDGRPRAGDVQAAARAAVARDVLESRAAATAQLVAAGATVIEAPAERLPELFLHAYLRAKARARV